MLPTYFQISSYKWMPFQLEGIVQWKWSWKTSWKIRRLNSTVNRTKFIIFEREAQRIYTVILVISKTI